MSPEPDEFRTETEEQPAPDAGLLVWSSFLVRLWRETPGEWRGQATHLETRETRHFVSFAQIQAFFAEHAPGLEISN